MKLTSAVRSAVLFSLKAYNLALDDIRLALEVFPSFLSRIFPEKKLRGLSPNSHIHVSVRMLLHNVKQHNVNIT